MSKDSPQTSVLRDAPKRIWAGKYHGTWWQSTPHHQMTPYILATTEALAASPEVQALIAEAVAQERAEIDRLREALIWCSGSDDFQDGGFAREGWLKLCVPLLKGDDHE